MDRLACIDIRDLPLQMLLKKHPQWSAFPAAVVSKDSPYGTICTVNRRAAECGIRAGQRYAGALSLNHELRADTVSGETIREGSGYLYAALARFSPQIEPIKNEPGVFWLDAGGLSCLYPDLQTWCAAIRRSLADQGFTAAIAVGFSRFGSYAAAKSTSDCVVFCDPESERAQSLLASLTVLQLSAQVLDRLEMLGIRSVGDFLRLPRAAVGKRFGGEVEIMHRFASGDLDLPLQPAAEERDPRLTLKLPHPVYAKERLLLYLGGALEEIASTLHARKRMVRELRISFRLDGHSEPGLFLEPLLPSSPTRDEALLRELLALRLESLRLAAAVEEIRIHALTVAENPVQTELFGGARRGARRAAGREECREVNRIFARLRSMLGNDCLQRARLEDDHIPERSFSWENLLEMPFLPDSRLPGRVADQDAPARAVRRCFQAPRPLSARRFRRRWGPYPLTGKWWRGEDQRRYCYAETDEGRILWLRLDEEQGVWQQIGAVE